MDRVRRMYAPFDGMRADHSRAEHPRAEHPRVPHTDPPDQTRQKRSEPQQKPTVTPESPDIPQSDSAAKTSSLLDVFMQDKDQSLILLLLVLLMKDGADMNLMLALMYLLI